MDTIIDKSTMKDINGNYITQALFLEKGYQTDKAVYTLKEEDYEYKGKLYPSIKRLYLEMEDTEEYEFANTYFCGWNHWQRIVNNNLFIDLIDSWRRELEIKLRGKAIKAISEISKGDTSTALVAAKWIAEGKWKSKKTGRPSKEEARREASIQDNIEKEFLADVARLKP